MDKAIKIVFLSALIPIIVVPLIVSFLDFIDSYIEPHTHTLTNIEYENYKKKCTKLCDTFKYSFGGVHIKQSSSTSSFSDIYCNCWVNKNTHTVIDLIID